MIETGSDERVTAGVSLSLGLALGMLLGSAPRLLVIIALAPVVAAGLVLADRRTKPSSRARRADAGQDRRSADFLKEGATVRGAGRSEEGGSPAGQTGSQGRERGDEGSPRQA